MKYMRLSVLAFNLSSTNYCIYHLKWNYHSLLSCAIFTINNIIKKMIGVILINIKSVCYNNVIVNKKPGKPSGLRFIFAIFVSFLADTDTAMHT